MKKINDVLRDVSSKSQTSGSDLRNLGQAIMDKNAEQDKIIKSLRDEIDKLKGS